MGFACCGPASSSTVAAPSSTAVRRKPISCITGARLTSRSLVIRYSRVRAGRTAVSLAIEKHSFLAAEYAGCCGFAYHLADETFVHITPTPVLPRLKGLDDWVLGLMKVFGGMLVLRRVAAANVAALQTETQVYPAVAHLQAFLAAFPTRLYIANLTQMRARSGHVLLLYFQAAFNGCGIPFSRACRVT